MSASWDSLRKEARRLETDIDAKLVEYSKLATSLQSSSRLSFDTHRPTTSEDEAVQRRAPARERAHAEAMTGEMEALLSRLNDVVQMMETGGGGGTTAAHARQRHAEILHDYRQEFGKTRAMVTTANETGELLGGVSIDMSGSGGMDSLYKERSMIHGASQGADAAIATGVSLKEDLERQRAMFASMVERMETMSEGLPAVNRLIGQIRRKKKRDVLVMAAVISILLFMTFSWKVVH